MNELNIRKSRKAISIVLIATVTCIILILIASVLLLILMGEGDSYYLEVNWNCSDEAFETEYHAKYLDKIKELKSQYNLTFQEKSEFSIKENGNPQILITLYCEEYVVKFKMINDTEIGWYDADLYYFGDSVDFSKLMAPLNFLNDFTNFAAYGTESNYNCFEKLYNEINETEKTYSSKVCHFDDIAGNVGYTVNLDYSTKSINSNGEEGVEKIHCFLFRFEGILKS